MPAKSAGMTDQVNRRQDRHCEPTGRDDRLREAIHCWHRKYRRVDCFVAEFIIGPPEGGTPLLLAMTSNFKCDSPFPRGEAPQGFQKTVAPINRRRKERPVPAAPTNSRAQGKEHTN